MFHCIENLPLLGLLWLYCTQFEHEYSSSFSLLFELLANPRSLTPHLTSSRYNDPGLTFIVVSSCMFTSLWLLCLLCFQVLTKFLWYYRLVFEFFLFFFSWFSLCLVCLKWSGYMCDLYSEYVGYIVLSLSRRLCPPLLI